MSRSEITNIKSIRFHCENGNIGSGINQSQVSVSQREGERERERERLQKAIGSGS
jgi:hypothetical protein